MDLALLERAYCSARYCVDDPAACFAIRIGESCAPLQALLRARGVTTWAFVTASNPRSQPLSCAENAARHQALLARVSALGLPSLAGHAMAEDGGWAEQSLLILGITAAGAVALGTRFEQNAVVVGHADGVARLIWCCAQT